ncbi:hypothetical protein [Citrobacter werkmanii]|uniref:hypothetical protein n=1 Tax=Citrobacter werkmanii TaxID=67827 RepID=UPI00300C1F47
MKLFVANCSRQKHQFNYKLPERLQQYGIYIRPGEQIMLDHDRETIMNIIEQHTPYGFQPCNKVDKSFSGICYSLDKEVTVGGFNQGAEQKTENLEDLSMEVLKAGALALDATIDSEVMKTGEVQAPAEIGAQIEIIGEPVNAEQDNAPSFRTTLKVDKKK